MKSILRLFLQLLLGGLCIIQGCQPSGDARQSLSSILKAEPSLPGKKVYLSSPYVTAGDRVYIIGNQDGTFPDLGWHLKGEMGGIWDHPIKLFDGFSAAINGQCLPPATRFDNFPEGNEIEYQSDTLDITRFQFIPDTLEGAVVEYTFSNLTDHNSSFTFDFTAMSDLLPVWLSDSLGIHNGSDTVGFDKSEDALVFKDRLNDWVAMVAGDRPSVHHLAGTSVCSTQRAGSGIDGVLSFAMEVPARGALPLKIFMTGSSHGEKHAREQMASMKKNPEGLLRDKIKLYHQIDSTSFVTLPDTSIQKMYQWLQYNIQWLMRDVPGTGDGLSAGLPDYPWWFGCDNTYALQGVLCAGKFANARKTIELLHQLSASKNGNGRITHEVSTNGVVFNPGNMNETPHFIMLLWDYFQWTGDLELIRSYYPSVQDGLKWLMTTDKDGDLCPDGPGMMEISGLNSEMIDVASYTCRAFQAASRMATILGDRENASIYKERFETIRHEINSEWWVSQQKSFADFRSNRGKALEVIASARNRAQELKKPWAVQELDALRHEILSRGARQNDGYVVYHNWVVNTPMETGLADSANAIAALNTAQRFTNPFGMYVTGIDRDEQAHNANIDSMRKKVFSYTGAVMTLPTGVQAVAECRYGRTEQALAYVKKLSNSFSYALPGSMYEVSPDFGMITQAWNIYGVEVPVVRYFFGIDPDAYHKSVNIHPALPAEWRDAKISRLRVGDNFITMQVQCNENGTTMEFHQTRKDWTINLVPPTGSKIESVNGARSENSVIQLSGLKNVVILKSDHSH